MKPFKHYLRTGLVAILLTAAILLPLKSLASESLIFLHYWTGAMSGGIDEMVEAFNEANPQYKVRATGFEHESFKVGINVMLSSGSTPDMFSYWAGAKVQALVDKNYLAPIDATWVEAGLDDIFPPSVGKACTYNDHKYALPLTQHYVTFFYNKKTFAKHGLTPPKNWKEFILVCDTLKQAGTTPIALGSREKWPAQFWFDYLLLRTAGPDYRQQLMQGTASYSDPEVDTVFGLWKSLLEAGYFNESPNMLNWSEAAKLVHSGKSAMTLMGTWAIGLFDSQLRWKQGEDYDFFRFPIMDTNIPMTALGPVDVIVVPREGKADKVNSVLAYFSDPGPQMEMSKGSGALSPSRSVPPSFYTDLQQRILAVIRDTPHWAFNYDLATPPVMADHGLTAFKFFVENPKSYKKIMAQLTRQADDYFAQQNN
ncbi:MAG: extracellular solute-binding protein [Pseudodesulfovibrio sp.]